MAKKKPKPYTGTIFCYRLGYRVKEKRVPKKDCRHYPMVLL